MPRSKKESKGRLDKFYHLAKDQGYRARSAFKLIQLNKKYQFLEPAKCVIDLCAAPGGWLQVAKKVMGRDSLIIGVDLEGIKSIEGVITHKEDILTSECRIAIKRDLKTWKADVVLHDGAPNVGVSWIQDAYTQNELVLAACKLASEFLVQGGTFVTKVFRSKDYNKLLYVLTQLFGKVEATKPTASRTVSAEIFVVCRDFLNPKKIDSRLLDPKFAFKEMDDVKNNEDKVTKSQLMNTLMHPEKRIRHREGYEDGNYTMYKTVGVDEFIASEDFLLLLTTMSAFTLDVESAAFKSTLTSDEIKEYLSDLKVLGRKEFKQVIRWRDAMRLLYNLKTLEVEEKKEEKEEREEGVELVMERERERVELKEIKEKRKRRERKAKILLRLKLGMETPEGIDQGELEQLPEFDLLVDQNNSSENSEDSDLDDTETNIKRLDSEMASMYEQYNTRKIERNPSLKVKKVKEGAAAFEEWYGIKEVEEAPQTLTPYDSGDESNENSDVESIDIPYNERQLSSKAALFFDNPIFKNDPLQGFDEEIVMVSSNLKKSKKVEEDKGFEVVPVSKVGLGFDDDDIIDSAEAYSLAQRMTTKSGKRDLVDDSFNRYAYNDAELPTWFTMDEGRHNKPTLSITKEAVKIMKDKMRALDARPIKKIAEAKFRKQLRTQRRILKATNQTQGMLDAEDAGTEKSKLEQAVRVMGKARSKGRNEKEKVKVVVARGSNRAIEGRPKGVKGRYKMVDGPMKKETRANKRVAKKAGKGGGNRRK